MTLNPAHLLETAFLLLAAFLIGAVTGSLARVVLQRLLTANKPAASAEPAPATAADAQPALVAAPVIEPVAKPEPPAAPADVPVPDFAEVVALTASAADAAKPEAKAPRLELVPETTPPKPVMAPARVAGQTTSGVLVPSPRAVVEAKRKVDTTGPSAEVIPFPSDRTTELAPAVPVEAKPAEPAAAPAPEPATAAAPEKPAADEQVAEPTAAPETPAETPAPAAETHDDEAAAMRAIESGGWSPKRTTRRTRVPKPDGIADDEPARSPRRKRVVDEAPGRPVGLDAPRNGTRDNLTNIIGVLPVLETALNQAGIYHFDQIAAFTDENVAWLEQHLGIQGRIDREHWREQARELAAAAEAALTVAGN